MKSIGHHARGEMRILLIDNNLDTTASMALQLTRAGFHVSCSDTAGDGFKMASTVVYDLIILELNLPDMPGDVLLSMLRTSGIQTPTLILTVLTGSDVMLRGFRSGADDCLIKPADPRETIARIHAILRRTKADHRRTVHVGNAVIDLDARSLWVGTEMIPLTRREFDVLELLTLRKGMTLNKVIAASCLYDSDGLSKTKNIDVFVCKLRKKLAVANGGDGCIDTIWGAGYRLRDPLLMSEHNHG